MLAASDRGQNSLAYARSNSWSAVYSSAAALLLISHSMFGLRYNHPFRALAQAITVIFTPLVVVPRSGHRGDYSENTFAFQSRWCSGWLGSCYRSRATRAAQISVSAGSPKCGSWRLEVRNWNNIKILLLSTCIVLSIATTAREIFVTSNFLLPTSNL